MLGKSSLSLSPDNFSWDKCTFKHFQLAVHISLVEEIWSAHYMLTFSHASWHVKMLSLEVVLEDAVGSVFHNTSLSIGCHSRCNNLHTCYGSLQCCAGLSFPFKNMFSVWSRVANDTAFSALPCMGTCQEADRNVGWHVSLWLYMVLWAWEGSFEEEVHVGVLYAVCWAWCRIRDCTIRRKRKISYANLFTADHPP